MAETRTKTDSSVSQRSISAAELASSGGKYGSGLRRGIQTLAIAHCLRTRPPPPRPEATAEEAGCRRRDPNERLCRSAAGLGVSPRPLGRDRAGGLRVSVPRNHLNRNALGNSIWSCATIEAHCWLPAETLKSAYYGSQHHCESHLRARAFLKALYYQRRRLVAHFHFCSSLFPLFPLAPGQTVRASPWNS